MIQLKQECNASIKRGQGAGRDRGHLNVYCVGVHVTFKMAIMKGERKCQ